MEQSQYLVNSVHFFFNKWGFYWKRDIKKVHRNLGQNKIVIDYKQPNVKILLHLHMF